MMNNMIANKSACCVSFNLGQTRMLFISCHLEAHDGNLNKRNEQWHLVHDRFVLK